MIIPVEVLVDGSTIKRMNWTSVEYFRLELDEHDLVWAEGLQAESYMFAGLRSDYENQDGPMTLHPTFSYAPEEDTCLPIAIAGPVVERVKASLARRARQRRPRPRRRARPAPLADDRDALTRDELTRRAAARRRAGGAPSRHAHLVRGQTGPGARVASITSRR